MRRTDRPLYRPQGEQQVADCFGACHELLRKRYIKRTLDSGDQFHPSEAVQPQIPVKAAVELYRNSSAPVRVHFEHQLSGDPEQSV